MTPLLVVGLGLFAAYAIYICALSSHAQRRAEDFLDGGRDLPGWATMLAGFGIILASLGLHDHFLLIAQYGLQYSHVALGLILVALCGVLVRKRVWLAARLSGLASPVELLGAYYQSIALRLVMLGLLALFAIPFAAHSLAQIGDLMEVATNGGVGRGQAIFASVFFLFLTTIIGGWRGAIYVVAGQSFLILVLMLLTGGFAGATFDRLAFFASATGPAKALLADNIPGVMQFTAGIGKELAVGGIWTSVAILSFGLSLIGIVLNPGFSFLGNTTSTRSGFAFKQVWITGALAAGALLLIAPVIGTEIAGGDAQGLAASAPSYAALITRLAGIDQLAALCFVLLLLAASQVAVAFFAAAGANIITLDLIWRFVLPDLTGQGRQLAARIALAIIFAAMALMAALAPLWSAVFGSVALSLSAQLLPAYLGLCWAPWISRSAVLTGLVFGCILVLFTEPPGLILFESLFIDLPWGRWPLTVHSAGWGLGFNFATCLLVAIFTRAGPERAHRQILHDEFHRAHRVDFGGPAARGAKWSLTLIWAFLAMGPGAILGNSFFSHPVFSDDEAVLGVASLWVWQILFWFLGVLIVWWLAYGGGMSLLEPQTGRRIELAPVRQGMEKRRAPGWISRLLSRVVDR